MVDSGARAVPRIDLNADVGEGFGAWAMGADAELLPLVTSANVACGFHAGDPAVMDRTVGPGRARGRGHRRASRPSRPARVRPARDPGRARRDREGRPLPGRRPAGLRPRPRHARGARQAARRPLQPGGGGRRGGARDRARGGARGPRPDPGRPRLHGGHAAGRAGGRAALRGGGVRRPPLHRRRHLAVAPREGIRPHRSRGGGGPGGEDRDGGTRDLVDGAGQVALAGGHAVPPRRQPGGGGATPPPSAARWNRRAWTSSRSRRERGRGADPPRRRRPRSPSSWAGRSIPRSTRACAPSTRPCVRSPSPGCSNPSPPTRRCSSSTIRGAPSFAEARGGGGAPPRRTGRRRPGRARVTSSPWPTAVRTAPICRRSRAACGLSEADVVKRGIPPPSTPRCFVGFLPGFAYLGLLAPELETPRRADPAPARARGQRGPGRTAHRRLSVRVARRMEPHRPHRRASCSTLSRTGRP